MGRSSFRQHSGMDYGEQRSTAALLRATMESMRRDAPETTPVQRRLALHALRQLARGHYLIVDERKASGTRLAGVPRVERVAHGLLDGGLVEAVAVPDLGATCYVISAAGRDALRRSERWWRGLTLVQRLKMRFAG